MVKLNTLVYIYTHWTLFGSDLYFIMGWSIIGVRARKALFLKGMLLCYLVSIQEVPGKIDNGTLEHTDTTLNDHPRFHVRLMRIPACAPFIRPIPVRILNTSFGLNHLLYSPLVQDTMTASKHNGGYAAGFYEKPRAER